jgi:hypothetical protein
MINLLPFFAGISSLLMFPLDFELKTELKNDQCSIETVCKVTKAGDTYTYLYSIRNTGNTTVKVKWDALDKALNMGRDIDMMWEVEPGENLNFILEHPDPPQEVGGRVQSHSLLSKKDLDKMVKGMQALPNGIKVDIPVSKLYQIDTRYASGILPKAFLTPAFMPRR